MQEGNLTERTDESFELAKGEPPETQGGQALAQPLHAGYGPPVLRTAVPRA
jgi:hypothetical protein